MTTVLKYMDNSQLYTYKAMITKIESLEDGTTALILDQSIFYPKGGGQPCDKGTIHIGNKIIEVERVFYSNQEVYHVVADNLVAKVGDDVLLNIDKDIRILYSKLHTLTHLIDDAMYILGYNFTPLMGCSYPDSTYVEYKGNLEEAINKDELKILLEEKVNEFITKGFEVKTSYAKKEELIELCYNVPESIENIDKPIRVVSTYGTKGIPCGGTHIKNISELKKATIRKISNKKGIIRISCNLVKEHD